MHHSQDNSRTLFNPHCSPRVMCDIKRSQDTLQGCFTSLIFRLSCHELNKLKITLEHHRDIPPKCIYREIELSFCIKPPTMGLPSTDHGYSSPHIPALSHIASVIIFYMHWRLSIFAVIVGSACPHSSLYSYK